MNIYDRISCVIFEGLIFDIIVECECTPGGHYSKSVSMLRVGGFCNGWSDSPYDWCYLDHGIDAKNCPGATFSQNNDALVEYYWTKDVNICKRNRG